MTEVEDRLRAAGTRFRSTPLPVVEPRWPSERSHKTHRRSLAVATAAAAAVAVIGGVAVTTRTLAHRPAPTTQPSVSPSLTASPGVGQTPDKAYAVAAPVLATMYGPVAPVQRPCRPATTTATATLRAAADGVLGLITLTGRGCSLRVDPAGISLLSQAGARLPVPSRAGNGINRGSAYRPDLAQAAGAVRVGFAWTGSYCGPAAASVELPAFPGGSNRSPALRIPLTGPMPACRPGGGSALVPGIVGRLSDAVEPAPAAWSALQADLVLPRTVAEGAIPLTVVLRTTGASPISLAAPCPSYRITMTVPTVPGRGFAGGTLVDESTGDLCGRPLVVIPGHPVTLSLSARSTPQAPWQIGGRLEVRWAIAGVPTASTTATIR